MCGICGFLGLDGESLVTEEVLRKMTFAQQHRGPDDEGFLCEPGVGLGFRRLAILDLTPAGHQPIPADVRFPQTPLGWGSDQRHGGLCCIGQALRLGALLRGCGA